MAAAATTPFPPSTPSHPMIISIDTSDESNIATPTKKSSNSTNKSKTITTKTALKVKSSTQTKLLEMPKFTNEVLGDDTDGGDVPASASASSSALSSESSLAPVVDSAPESASDSAPALIKPLPLNDAISYKGLTEQAQRRLVKDIASLYRDPLTEQGIYYQHDSDNMNLGYAMIIGPKDTPYSHGFFLFKFEIPTLYPNLPPRVTYLTQDTKERTRFNPNLYTNGYVCLSVLNTWKGEGWTSCQTIRSVLMTLVTVLNDTPLCNEPNIGKSHPDFHKYNDILRYKTYQMAFLRYLKDPTCDPICEMFSSYMRQYALREKEGILECLNAAAEDIRTRKIVVHQCAVYGFSTVFKYDSLIDNITKWYEMNGEASASASTNTSTSTSTST